LSSSPGVALAITAGMANLPSIEVTISAGVFSDENSQRFALQAGGSLRIGRDPGNHVVLDLNGVSGTHAELLFQPLSKGAAAELCICDHSKNSTAVRPGPHVPGSSWANKVPPTWERLVQGVPRAVTSGWQLLAPARSRKGEKQMPFHKRMLTVYTKAPTHAAAVAAVVADASMAALAATPEEARKEKKRKRHDEKEARKRAKQGEQVVAPAAAAAAAPDRRVAQAGAVEEELARRARQLAAGQEEITRTARPKGKPKPAQAAEAPAGDESDHTIVDGLVSDAEGAAAAEEVRDPEADEAEAATRAVAAAAALRAMKSKKSSPMSLKALGSGQKPKPVEAIDSDDEKQAAPLTAANVATLGGGGNLIEFDLRSISPISMPGVKPKKKEKRKTTRMGGDSQSPARHKRGREEKPRLVARSKDSPGRWNPGSSPPRRRSRDKRKQREADRGGKSRR